MNWRVEEIPELRGYVVEWAEPGRYLLSRRNLIYQSQNLKQPFKLLTRIDSPLWRRAASISRLAQRALRFSVNNLVPLSNGEIFVSFDKAIGLIHDGKYQQLRGLERPCRILRSGVAVNGQGDLYFGEYIANPDRTPVRLYRYVPGNDNVEVVHEFPAGKIRHVHGIYYDRYDHSLLCLTGDADSECNLLRSYDGFASVDALGGDDESWRAVSALFTADAVYYGTDAEHRTNTIYRYDRGTGQRNALGEVTGTVFYSHSVNDEMFFATTAENAPSQQENVAAIWRLNSSGELTELAKFAKDRWHPTLFGFGTVYFPHISSISDKLFFSLSATEQDNRTFQIVLSD